ncbi:MAG: FG-GAP-like repeat-containing protein [Bacteroidales bacterium]|nr:FG-GAP-like repeat-containing protein [Bacteroidales bacterium]
MNTDRTLLACESLEDRLTPAIVGLETVAGTGVLGPIPVGAGFIGAGSLGTGVLPSNLLVSGTPDGNGQLVLPNANRSGYQLPGANQPLIPGFPGLVRVALADVTGDSIPDWIAGAGPGGQQVVIRDGASGAILANFLPFESSFNGGVFVSAGDINQDGRAEVVVTPDLSGGPRVKVYDGLSLSKSQTVVLADFFGIADRAGVVDGAFRGGARTAIGDINGNGFPDVIVAAGFGGGPRVTVWEGASIARPNGTQPSAPPIANFFAFEPTLRNGLVAAGDVNGDRYADLVFGGGPGGGPRVRVASGASISAITTDFGLDDPGRASLTIMNFFAGDPNTRAGIRVTMRNLDGDGFADLVTGSGAGLTPEVRVYRGASLVANPLNPDLAQVFTPFSQVVTDGVYVG